MALRSSHRLGIGLVALATVATAAPATASTPPDTTEAADPGEGTAISLEAVAPQPFDEPVDVTISVSGAVSSFLPILLAAEMGEFERENLNVTLEFLPATEGTLLVSQGRVDAAAIAVNAGNLNLIASGMPLRFAFPYEPEFTDPRGSGVWVRNDVLGDDGLQPDDLRGEPISSSTGIPSGALGYFWLHFLNVDGDFPISDLNAQQYSNPDTPEALINGGLSAGIVFSPFQTMVEESGCCTYIEGSDAPFPYGWVIIGERLYEEDRDVGVALFRAIARTRLTYLQGDFINDPEVGPVVAEVLGQPLDALQAQHAQPVWDAAFSIDPEGVLKTQEYWREIPDVLDFDEPLTVEQVFDLDMYHAALGLA